MAASDATAIPIKNQAYRVTFPILDADGDLVTGAAGLDSEVSKDAGTFADVTAEATEIATASGMYYLDLTATEMNADTVAIIVKTTTTGAKTTPIVLYPAETTDIPVNVTAIGGVAQSATDLKDMVDTGYDPATHKIQSDLIYIHGTALTETDGQLAAAFKKLFDVATPLLVASTVMRGTDSAALATTALSTATWTAARAGALTDWINGGRLDNLLDAIPTTAMRGTDNAALATTALTNVTWTDAKAGALADWINGGRLDNLLDAIPTTAMRGTDNATLAATWTDARAGYLDNLSAGAVALASGVDLTSIHGAALTETVNGYLAAAFTKLFDVATPLLVASEVMRGTDGANTTVPDAAGVAPTAVENAIAVWDRILSGATHNIASSAGRRVREIGAYAIEAGTAQAGNSHSITLSATASAVDGTYNRNLIILTDNTGVGQTRTIVDYNGTTKVAVIDRDWRTSPDATTTYQVTPDNTPLVVDQGVAQSGTSTTIKLRAYASSTNDIYLCNVVAIIAGAGRGQARLIGAYNGTTKVATICGDNWVTTPDATSVYVLMPYGTTCTSCIGTYALGLINTEVKDCLTIDQIADSYATDGAQPTIAQGILAIQQMLQEKSISGTTLTVKKPDGSTVAMTFTLDSATAPTSITRAT